MFFSTRHLINHFFSRTIWLLDLLFCLLFDQGLKRGNYAVIICLIFYSSLSLGETITEEVKHQVIESNESKSSYYTDSLDSYLAKAAALQESEEHEAAVLVFKNAWEIDRIQSGLYSESQIPIIENIIFSSIELDKWDSVNKQFDYLEHLYRKLYDAKDPRLDSGLQKILSWHISILNQDIGGHRLRHLRKAHRLFKSRLDIARLTLDSQDPLLQYLKENIALSQRELYLYSDVGREMVYAQTLPSGASLLVKMD